jgi:hypothetical protein
VVAALTRLKTTSLQRWASLKESWRVAIALFVITRLAYAVWSWVIFTVQPLAVENFQLANEPLVSVFRLKGSQANVFLREVNGSLLIFQPAGPDEIIDDQSRTVWQASDGRALRGPQVGQVLGAATTSVNAIFPYHGVQPHPGLWLAMWQRFDANWYLSIAENGYGKIPGDIHFPPLYPLLMRTLRPVTGSTFLAGLLIAHLGTLAALKLLYDTYLQWGPRILSRRALLFFMLYPAVFFLFSAYTESLFLVVALLALRTMQLRKWGWAGFWIFCAILLRLQGVALLVPMLFMLWRDPPVLRSLSHWVGLIIAGTAGLTYLYMRSQVAFQHTLPFVETDLHARLVLPWQSYVYALVTMISRKATFIDLINWAATTLFFILILWGWKKIPPEYSLFSLASFLVLLTRVVETQPLMSMLRYTITLFPCFYALSLAGENPVLRRIILYTFLALNLYLSGQFFIWGWVA